MDFKNKTALVTGGCGGLGAAITKAFLDAGAQVVAVDINPTLIGSFGTEHEKTSEGRLLVHECDITNDEALEKLFQAAVAKFGAIDCVVNNAGIMDKVDPVGDLERKLWDKVIAVNLTAPYVISKFAINHMLEKKVKGSIVNVASMAASAGTSAGAAYTASKHGLIGLTKNTAAFYADKGIRCNAIMPGGMETNVSSAFAQGYHEEGMALLQKRYATSKGMSNVAEVAATVLFLSSDAASAVSGALMAVDKGWQAA